MLTFLWPALLPSLLRRETDIVGTTGHPVGYQVQATGSYLNHCLNSGKGSMLRGGWKSCIYKILRHKSRVVVNRHTSGLNCQDYIVLLRTLNFEPRRWRKSISACTTMRASASDPLATGLAVNAEVDAHGVRFSGLLASSRYWCLQWRNQSIILCRYRRN
jgi:hypothetical protein